MAGLAQILKESGHEVSGSDNQFYPPMSEYIKKMGIETQTGYSKNSLPNADLYVIGNALSRGNEYVEEIIERKLPFVSGPEMLGRELKNRDVFAISGTHGKTTTSYMLTHIFRNQEKDVGYLIGGISEQFQDSAKLGTDKIFVIEADEYDSAFFDKRSKFIHYSPLNLIINNIEFDHADIFNNIDDIKKQFHHLLKIIPKSGNLIYFKEDKNSSDVIKSGLWCNEIAIGSNEIEIDLNQKNLIVDGDKYSLKNLPLSGEHNFKNYVCAILAARKGGISIEKSIDSLNKFKGVKRRMDLVADLSNIKVYDDFAHHPTAIKMSTESIREKHPNKKILGIVELGSNTMSSGYHNDNLIESFKALDETLLLDRNAAYNYSNGFNSEKEIIECIKTKLIKYDIILIMTNKDSQKFIKPIIENLENK